MGGSGQRAEGSWGRAGVVVGMAGVEAACPAGIPREQL